MRQVEPLCHPGGTRQYLDIGYFLVISKAITDIEIHTNNEDQHFIHMVYTDIWLLRYCLMYLYQT